MVSNDNLDHTVINVGHRVRTFGSLFAGIGGIDLGLERAGWRCAWQVEIDPFARRVLGKHWPDVIRFRDVRECSARNLAAVDLIAGGFPCQDVSHAGKQRGLSGDRSGLWFEFRRVVCELRPRLVLVENVSALRRRGFDVVLGDLATLGFDAEWESVRALDVGAPHQRERVFIVAHAAGDRRSIGRASLVPYQRNAHGLEPHRHDARMGAAFPAGPRSALVSPEPFVRRGTHGLSNRVDRVARLGNAVVPHIAEMIGRRLIEVGA